MRVGLTPTIPRDKCCKKVVKKADPCAGLSPPEFTVLPAAAPALPSNTINGALNYSNAPKITFNRPVTLLTFTVKRAGVGVPGAVVPGFVLGTVFTFQATDPCPGPACITDDGATYQVSASYSDPCFATPVPATWTFQTQAA